MEKSIHQLTLRLPRDLVESLRREAREEGRTLNELARVALQEFAEREAVRRAVQEIAANRRLIEKRGLQPDSVPVLRGLREGQERR
jgi:predicted transcriptional regulator